MIATLLVALLVQVPAPRSMLGREKPWWERLKRGDVVELRPMPGTAVPLIYAWRRSGPDGRLAREDIYLKCFVDAAARGRWSEIHGMADRIQIEGAFGRASVQIVAIRDEIPPKMRVAEVVVLSNYDRAGVLLDKPRPMASIPDPYPSCDTLFIPVAYLQGRESARHPDLDRLPAMVRRSRDLSSLDCDAEDCSRLEAIPYAEAERAWKEKQRRSEEIRRRAAAEAERRAG